MKTLCEWSEKDIAKKLGALSALVNHPRFVCNGCARAANKKGALCKPTKLEERDPSGAS